MQLNLKCHCGLMLNLARMQKQHLLTRQPVRCPICNRVLLEDLSLSSTPTTKCRKIMKTIALSDIQIAPNRHRRSFDPKTLQELVDDIRENGLFNAIVLRVAPSGDDFTPDSLCLCQGERRMRAIQDLWALGGELHYDGVILPEGMVPYVTLGDLEPLQAEIAELSENLRRDDLTWQEKAAATSRIMKLRTEQAAREGDPPPPVSVIAEELRGTGGGSDHEYTRKEILLADLIKTDPEIAAEKTLRDAWALAKRKESTRRNVELAETVGRSFSAADHTIVHADAAPWLAACPEGTYDVILTDPPYGMGADEFGDSGGAGGSVGAHRYEDSATYADVCFSALLKNAMRITKPQAHLYIFCDIDRFCDWRWRLEQEFWWVHRTPLIWHKTNGSRVPWPENGPQRKYELILYAVKGKRPVTGIQPDVISIPTEPTNLGHSAQKPVALYADLLRRSARPGDTVLDPFSGSGPLLPAAHGLKCRATLIEQDADAYGIILNRAKELK